MTMITLKTLAITGLTALSICSFSASGMAQSAGAGGGGSSAASSSDGQGGGGSRTWSFRGSANGPIICASAACMARATSPAAAAGTPPSNYQRPDRVRNLPAESCNTVRYVYPNGTVIVQKECPRAVTGVISTHR
jgi:hypothetical protein